MWPGVGSEARKSDTPRVLSSAARTQYLVFFKAGKRSYCLMTDIVEHPDAPRVVFHGKDELILNEREFNARYVVADDQPGALE